MDDKEPAAPNPSSAPPSDEVSCDLRTIAALKACIREAVARRRGEPTRVARPVDWHLLAAGLRQVEKYADIGSGVPDLPRFRGPFRLLGRLFARCVLYFARFLTNRQREYNNAVLNSLRNLAEALRRLEDNSREELRRWQLEPKHLPSDSAKKAA